MRERGSSLGALSASFARPESASSAKSEASPGMHLRRGDEAPELIPEYSLSACSGDFSEWIEKVPSTRHPYSYTSLGEDEIFEFDQYVWLRRNGCADCSTALNGGARPLSRRRF